MNPVRPLNKYKDIMEIYGFFNIYAVWNKTGFGGLTG